MRTREGTVLAMLLVLCACGNARPVTEDAPEEAVGLVDEPVRKYAAKSGVIESRTEGMGTVTTVTYFDDYGAREATYTTTEMEVMGTSSTSREVLITADGWTTEYDPDARTGERWNLQASAAAAPGALSQLADLLPAGGASPVAGAVGEAASSAKELEPRTIAGRQATGVAMEVAGTKMRIWQWEGLTMRSEMEMGQTTVVTQVVRLDLGVPVPPDRFRVPEDVVITELRLP